MEANFEKLDESLKVLQKMQWLTGINHRSLISIREKVLRFIFRELFLFFVTLFYYRVQSLLEFAEHSVMAFILYGVYAKQQVMIVTFDEVEDVLDDCRDILKFCRQNQIQISVSFRNGILTVRKQLKIFWFSCFMTIFAGTCFSLVTAQNVPYRTYIMVQIPFFEFNQNYTYYVVTELYVFIGCFFSVATEVATISFPVLLISLGALLYDELGKVIKNIEVEFSINKNQRNRRYSYLTEKKHEEKVIRELKLCIEFHKRIKDLLRKVQVTASPIIFAQVMASSIIFCMLTFTISIVSKSS